jgi:hypothetical protein
MVLKSVRDGTMEPSVDPDPSSSIKLRFASFTAEPQYLKPPYNGIWHACLRCTLYCGGRGKVE